MIIYEINKAVNDGDMGHQMLRHIPANLPYLSLVPIASGSSANIKRFIREMLKW